MERILIVDDEESIRVSLSALIARSGYVVETASRAADALQLMDERDFDVAFVDVRMPGMDGIAFTREVVQRGILTTVIVMSAYGSVDSAREAMKAGAYDYITKPFKTDEVILTLAKAREREGLRRENARLRAAMLKDHTVDGMVFASGAMQAVSALVDKIARVDSTVLILGESGTGKELVARAIHARSPRSGRQLVAINCGAIPETLIESELFGHRRGAFTDARQDRAGVFVEADGGTLLLDEIGELPLPLQVKLLRVLQEGTFRPLGARNDTQVNVRIIAATVQDLEEQVTRGTFREDLFYRLNVLPIRIPPLRERGDDILLLARHFIERNNEKMGVRVQGLTDDACRLLRAFSWPGNVRELQNAIERAQVLAEGDFIAASDLPASILNANDPVRTASAGSDLSIKKAVRSVEEELIRRALAETGGNRTAAARLLEISHRALLYKLKEFGIS